MHETWNCVWWLVFFFHCPKAFHRDEYEATKGAVEGSSTNHNVPMRLAWGSSKQENNRIFKASTRYGTPEIPCHTRHLNIVWRCIFGDQRWPDGLHWSLGKNQYKSEELHLKQIFGHCKGEISSFFTSDWGSCLVLNRHDRYLGIITPICRLTQILRNSAGEIIITYRCLTTVRTFQNLSRLRKENPELRKVVSWDRLPEFVMMVNRYK